MLDQVALAYGGFDSICVTAGIFVPSDTTGHIPDDKWALTFNINVTGSDLVADEAFKTWKAKGLRGNLVLTTSANTAVAKKGSLAYDTSKAAANHLVRELVMELSPLVRVNGVAPATVVQGSAMFPRDRVIGSLAKYDIAFTEDEATDSLVTKLAQFYADRTLTKSPITPADQADAYFLLVSKRLSKTTGQGQRYHRSDREDQLPNGPNLSTPALAWIGLRTYRLRSYWLREQNGLRVACGPTKQSSRCHG